MRIGDALPWVVERRYPIIRPEFNLLTVLYLLRMQDIDAVPLTPRGGRSRKAVFGYSSLSKVASLEPGAFAAYLKGPCEAASQSIATRKTGDELSSLFEAFAARRLGFVLLYGENRGRDQGSLVSLTDVLELYRDKTIRTDLKVSEVASPAYSVPGSMSLRDALRTMFRQRMRRVFIEGERRCVSDRDMIYEVFTPTRLDEMGEGQTDSLAVPVGQLKGSYPESVQAGASVANAAETLGRRKGECLMTRAGSIVTPWDVLMKPWLAGKLSVA